MAVQRKNFTLRVESELLEKMRYVAEKDKRSLNSMLEVAIEQIVNNYETQYGPINVSKN